MFTARAVAPYDMVHEMSRLILMAGNRDAVVAYYYQRRWVIGSCSQAELDWDEIYMWLRFVGEKPQKKRLHMDIFPEFRRTRMGVMRFHEEFEPLLRAYGFEEYIQ